MTGVLHHWPDGKREVVDYGGAWMPWKRKSRREIVDEAIARLREDLAPLRDDSAQPQSGKS